MAESSTLAAQLQRVAIEAAAIAAVAEGPRQDVRPAQARVRQFAVALHRHAKGAEAAARAWLQELQHQA